MLTGLSLPVLSILLTTGVLLDLFFGEVRRYHPLVGFGRYAMWIEARLNRQTHRFAKGVFAWSCAVLPITLFSGGLIRWSDGRWPLWSTALHAMLLYFCLGLRSLRDHCVPIGLALKNGYLEHARELTARIVSRDTQHSTLPELAKASVESLLENGNDAVFGTLFWFVVAGGPGALLFRLANTLDAMWGYRSPRFQAFGCAAARIDDGLNWIPARLTAFSYAMLGDRYAAWHCWRTQAGRWSSPNAGPVMAAGAGSLGLSLGGSASYDGVIELRPQLGVGQAPDVADIGRAWHLVATTAACWCGAILLAGAVMYWEG